MHRTMFLACAATALACSFVQAAGEREAVKLTAVDGRWRAESATYQAVVEANGCLSSLKVQNIEFLDARTGVSKGVYLWLNNRVEPLGTVSQLSPTSLAAEGAACRMLYTFERDGIRIALADKSTHGLTLTAVFDRGLEGVRIAGQALARPPVNATGARARWCRGAVAIDWDGPARFFGPWGNGNQVMTAAVKPGETGRWSLAIAALTADEQAAIAQLAPAVVAKPAAVEPADDTRPLEQIRIAERDLNVPPAMAATTDAPAEGVRSLYYDGPAYHGKPSRVFAYYGAPPVKAGEKVPAMVLVHGGVGTAYADWVRLWVSRGYAAIAMDLCGCLPVRAPDGKNWSRIADGGPAGWEAAFGQLHEPLQDQWPYYAVNAIAQARTLLGSFPEVDDQRVGLTGISWGGYLTCLAAALDPRYLFAAPVYGCGFLRDKSAWTQRLQAAGMARWDAQFDPRVYLPQVKMPLLWVAGTNDRFYPIESLTRSRARVPAPVTMCIKPRMTHSQEAGAKPTEIGVFADRFCKGGTPLPEILDVRLEASGIAHVTFHATTPVTTVCLLYTTNTDGAYPDWPWESLAVPADPASGTAAVALPTGARWWFFNLTDSRGLTVSTTPVAVAAGARQPAPTPAPAATLPQPTAASAPRAADAAGAPPPATPRLDLFAEFNTNTRCPVFEQGAAISVGLTVAGRRFSDDALSWSILDWAGTSLACGTLPVSKGDGPWKGALNLPQTPCGYFELRLMLEKAEVTLARAGSRPAGFLAYAVLPKITRLKLHFADDSRFGGQGSNFIKSGEWMKGDFVDPVYPLVGMNWIYLNRRPAELAAAGPDTYKPCLDPDRVKERGASSCERAAGLCLLIDAHSLPAWLTKYPAGAHAPERVVPTNDGQAYPPNDDAQYAALIGQIAAEQAANRATNYPHQRRNYYQIHWEPDWHWKGTDAEFIRMYATAAKAIHDHDPDGLLLGANYGVLAAGNRNLSRLFEQGLGRYLDGIVTHTYYIPEGQDPETGNLIADVRELVALTRRYLKPGAPIINSEWGTGFAPDATANHLRTLKSEAARFMRGHIIALGEGVDTTFYFYTADCGLGGGGLFYNLTAPNPVFGATHVAPKTVMATAAVATRLIDGTRNLGALEHLGDGAWGYAFDRDGVVLAVLWSSDNQDREIDLPVGAAEITCYDPMGNASSVKARNGLARIRIGAVPCYALGLAHAAIPTVNPGRAGLSSLAGGTLPASSTAAFGLSCGGAWFDLGHGSALHIPRAAAAGKSLLVAMDPADGHWLSSVTLDIHPSARLALTPGGITVSNATAEALAGELAVSTSDAAPVLMQRLELPAKGSANVPLKMDQTSLRSSADQALRLTFTDDAGSRSVTSAVMHSSYVARRALHPPKLEGALTEWPLESFVTASGAEAVKVNRTAFAGDADLSFRLAMQYDQDALYVAVNVRDQQFCQEHGDADAWQEDSVQLGVALHPTPSGWASFAKFCFAKSSKTGALLGYCHNGPGELPPGRLPPEIRFNVTRSTDETHYVIAIPWRCLEKTLAACPAEHRIGVGIFVNDVDDVNGVKSKRKAMEAFGGMAYTLPRDFGTVTLAE